MLKLLTIPNYGDVLAGFVWQPWVADERPNARELIAYFEDTRVDMFCEHQNRGAVSFGESELDPDIYRAPSLASIMASSLMKDWLGVFRVDKSYWLGGAINGHPFPMADRVFNTIEEANTAFKNALKLGKFQLFYFPSGYEGISTPPDVRLEHRELEHLIDPDVDPVFLRTLHQSWREGALDFYNANQAKVKKWGLAAAAAVVALMVGTGLMFSVSTTDISAETARIAQAAQAERKAAEQRKREEAWSSFTATWQNTATPLQFFNACADALYATDTTGPAWVPKLQSCEGTKATAHFVLPQNTEPDVSVLERFETQYGFSVSFINRSEYRASRDLAFPVSLRTEELTTLEPVLRNISELEERAFDSFTRLGTTPHNKPDTAEDERDFAFSRLQFTQVWDVELLVNILNTTPGFVIDKARLHADDLTWNIEGLLYHVE